MSSTSGSDTVTTGRAALEELRSVANNYNRRPTQLAIAYFNFLGQVPGDDEEGELLKEAALIVTGAGGGESIKSLLTSAHGAFYRGVGERRHPSPARG